MILPNNLPNWYKIIQDSNQYNLKININIDPLSGKQSGHFYYQDKTYPFKMEIYKNNLFLSLKDYSKDLFDIWAKLLEIPYRILYQTETEFPYNAEWYFDCNEQDVIDELIKIINCDKIIVLDLNQLNLY